MRYLAVIDTNILVSYLLTKNRDSSVVKIIELVKEGIIVPLIQKARDTASANHPSDSHPDEWSYCITRYSAGIRYFQIMSI